jgi:hypothetical protein
MLTSPTLAVFLEDAAERVRSLRLEHPDDVRLATLETSFADAAADICARRVRLPHDAWRLARRLLQIHQLALFLSSVGPADARAELALLTTDLGQHHIDLDALVTVLGRAAQTALGATA